MLSGQRVTRAQIFDKIEITKTPSDIYRCLWLLKFLYINKKNTEHKDAYLISEIWFFENLVRIMYQLGKSITTKNKHRLHRIVTHLEIIQNTCYNILKYLVSPVESNPITRNNI